MSPVASEATAPPEATGRISPRSATGGAGDERMLADPMTRYLLALTLALVPVPMAFEPCGASLANLGAQPRCKKGCPCGNSCISCSKTCRIASIPRTEPPVEQSKPEPPPARSLTSVPRAPGGWVGSSVYRLYFLASCPIALAIPDRDRVEVRDSTTFASIGFRRLVVPGC
jgi:hypothetical protein